MPAVDRYAVEIFRRGQKGAFTVARSMTCKTAAEALRKAEGSCRGKADHGAAAFLLRGDDDIGATEAPVTIGLFGLCPPDLTDEIPF